MSRLLVLICLAGMLLGGCGSAALSTGSSAATVQPAVSGAQPTAAPAPAASDCPITEAILDEPPKDPNSDPFGRGYWYINADRTIWADAPESQSWRAGDAKVIWIRPQGTQLVITGQRLDGDAPQLRAEIPCCYPTGFQATGLNFPTGGCWEVTARAGKSELRFVTYVTPSAGSATN
jgi:hypothetical protein